MNSARYREGWRAQSLCQGLTRRLGSQSVSDPVDSLGVSTQYVYDRLVERAAYWVLRGISEPPKLAGSCGRRTPQTGTSLCFGSRLGRGTDFMASSDRCGRLSL